MTVTTQAGDPMDRRLFRIWFWIIVAGSAALRLVYVLAAKRDEAVVGDQIYYSAQAVTIANGMWFADPFIDGRFAADHAPLTSLLLALVSWSDQNPVLAQRLLMAFLGVLVVMGIGLLARWLFGRRIALIATFLAGVYASLWMNDALLMSETIATAGVVAVLLAVYVYDRRRNVGWAVAIGLALGFAGLARAELLLLGPMVVIPLMLIDRNDTAWSVRIRRLATAAVVSLLVIAPWVVRNVIRFDETTFISTQDGLTLIGANCPDTYAGPLKGFWSLQCADLMPIPADADQSMRSRLYREFAFDYISENRSKIPGVVAARLGRGLSVWQTGKMTFLTTGEGREAWASKIGLWQYWILAPLALFGWWLWPSNQARWPALVTAGLSVLTFMAVYGIVRFRIPAEVIIVLGAAITLNALGETVYNWWHKTRA